MMIISQKYKVVKTVIELHHRQIKTIKRRNKFVKLWWSRK